MIYLLRYLDASGRFLVSWHEFDSRPSTNEATERLDAVFPDQVPHLLLTVDMVAPARVAVPA